MSITITDYMQRKNDELFTNVKEITDISKTIKKLEQDSKVQEYLAKKTAKEKLEQELKNQKIAFQKKLGDSCNHNFLLITPKKELYEYHHNEIACVLCEKHFKNSEIDLDSYYNHKRLIAYAKQEHDYYEGRTWIEYLPIYVSAEHIRNYYYELTQKIEKEKTLKLNDIIPTDFNIEDAVWDHFCNTSLQKDKDKKIKKLTVHL